MIVMFGGAAYRTQLLIDNFRGIISLRGGARGREGGFVKVEGGGLVRGKESGGWGAICLLRQLGGARWGCFSSDFRVAEKGHGNRVFCDLYFFFRESACWLWGGGTGKKL